jgi:hypothetical protein
VSRASAEARKQRSRRQAKWILGGAVALVAAIALLVALLGGGSSPTATSVHHDTAAETLTGPAGPEGISLEEGTPLAPATTAATGQPVDGIQCQQSEQVVYHVHTHLTVYVNGVLRPIPPGIGTVAPVAQETPQGPFYGATSCYYWLHVHAQDGVIHIESPSVRAYTLGQFFDLWRQPLSATQVGPAPGPITVFVDGQPYHGDPAGIALGSREDIQINAGAPTVPPKRVDWGNSEL